jgi:competence ComEA-like helix-hairpin-helix protein
MISLFTTRERRVILFLSFLFIIGNGIRLYRATFQADDKTILDLGSLEPADSTEVARLLESSRELRDVQEKTRNVQFPIDINNANLWELVALPGIGNVLAERIVEYRNTAGPFRRIEDLKGVRGIGREKLKDLEPFVTIGDFQPTASEL